jgi:hypothetical protein
MIHVKNTLNGRGDMATKHDSQSARPRTRVWAAGLAANGYRTASMGSQYRMIGDFSPVNTCRSLLIDGRR